VRTAQPSGRKPPTAPVTQRPNALAAASVSSTTAISSTYVSPIGTILFAVPQQG